MAHQASALPKIPVKTERVTKRLQFDPALVKRVDAFCDFYAQTAGAKPDWNDAAVALIDHALERNREFAKYLAEQAKPAA